MGRALCSVVMVALLAVPAAAASAPEVDRLALAAMLLRDGHAERAARVLDGVDPATETLPTSVYWLFQAVFAGTAATIVSGAMAERMRFTAYLMYSFLLTAFIYPIVVHWVWGGGWLASLDFHDFAGSTVVHAVGGTAALVGACPGALTRA